MKKLAILMLMLVPGLAFGQTNWMVGVKGTQDVTGVKFYTNQNLRVDLTPTNAAGAASKSYVDTVAASKVTTSATMTALGNLNLGGFTNYAGSNVVGAVSDSGGFGGVAATNGFSGVITNELLLSTNYFWYAKGVLTNYTSNP